MVKTKQRYLFPVLLVLLLAISRIVAADPSNEVHIPNADEILNELNVARTTPKIYVEYIENLRQYYDGNKFMRPGEITIRTKEGLQAVDEAITFLKSITPVTRLTWSVGLSKAAIDHVIDQSRTGDTWLKGKDGTWVGERADRYGAWTGVIGENIQYGDQAARDVVISLIVDDGVPSRGHRDNIFERDYRFVGVACGSHPEWRTICVMDFSQSYQE